MAIIPGKFCEHCADEGREGVPAEYELDSDGYGSGGGGFLCDGCATRMAEDQHEAFLERYYGSSQPVTLSEQYQAAATVKREQR